ncbi:uncharacterized protein LOC104896041 [Beta vulgaris subsp. vulgaris]|uniref:uncharacterized protein LOC104896041 n=1 Tax=Beta vulgaris subsp. vulgaris TaxID=3555 RepID=UPI0020370AF0|nr:uncharacterized protein LOC104896041 [Beta vulgaris subsp. vulgaris]
MLTNLYNLSSIMETLNSNSLLSLHRTRIISEVRLSSPSINGSSFINLSTFKIQRSASSNSLAWSNMNLRKNCMGAVIAAQGNDKVEVSAATPGPSSENPWYKWLLGVIISLVFPFARNKWGPLLTLKNKVDTAVETVEVVVETVEKVAEGVYHVADEVANQLPEGGKLQNIVCEVANVAEEAAKDAHFVDQLIEKVEDIEKQVVSTFLGEEQETATKVKDSEIKEDNTQTKKELEQKQEKALEFQVPSDASIDDQPK